MAHQAQPRPVSDSDGESAHTIFLFFGNTMVGLQRELLQAYQRVSRIWLERMQVEVVLWRRLASDLASSKSDADILKAYTDHMTRQFRMTAEDGRHVFSDYQEIVRKIARTDGEDAQAIPDPGPEMHQAFAEEVRVTH
ncbi:MAG TPA: hypothetical protein VFI23_12315 [Rhizomicrobium sp.]|nr:hypothetical protein [Rhizomicrobium sp.]